MEGERFKRPLKFWKAGLVGVREGGGGGNGGELRGGGGRGGDAVRVWGRRREEGERGRGIGDGTF